MNIFNTQSNQVRNGDMVTYANLVCIECSQC